MFLLVVVIITFWPPFVKSKRIAPTLQGYCGCLVLGPESKRPWSEDCNLTVHTIAQMITNSQGSCSSIDHLLGSLIKRSWFRPWVSMESGHGSHPGEAGHKVIHSPWCMSKGLHISQEVLYWGHMTDFHGTTMLSCDQFEEDGRPVRLGF